MRKKKLILAVLAVSLLTTGALVGCKKKKEEEALVPVLKYEISLGSEQMSMIIGEEKALDFTYTKQNDTVISYASSDATVVKVDENGKLTALKAGTATITVTYGTASDSCVVTVGLNGLLPSLQLTNIVDDYLYIEQTSQLDLRGNVLFNGVTYTDVELSYSVSDGNVGKVENGIFTPLAIGTTEITVTGTWRGISGVSLTKTITVDVKPELLFMVNGGASEITLYTQTDKVSPFEITAKYGNVDLNPVVEITSGSKYVAYDPTAQTITSLGVTGKAEVSVTYELEGETVVNIFPVYVKPTIYNYTETITDFSAIHGDVAKGKTLKVLLGGDIVSATDENGNKLDVEDNKIYGLDWSDDTKTEGFESTITVCLATHGYTMTLQGYSGIFARATDFAVFNTNAKYAQVDGNKKFVQIDKKKPIQRWDGYYVLANNIDAGASNYVHADAGSALAQRGLDKTYDDIGFHGTFDGRGYTVKGMSIGEAGIFGYLIDAEVKNVAFAEVELRNVERATVLSARIINSDVSNVYVGLKTNTQLTEYGAVFATGIQASNLKGCFVETPENFGYALIENTTTTTDPTTQEETTVTTYFRQKLTGSFVYQIDELVESDAGTSSSYLDVYVVSKETLGWKRIDDKGTGYYFQGEGENLADEANGILAYTINGVKRYNTLAQMQMAGNNYAYFSKTYWTFDTGAPVWKSLNGEYPSVELIDEIPKKETVGDFDENWLQR